MSKVLSRSRYHEPNSESCVPARKQWLAARFGEVAGIVLDSHGVIVAANEGAAALLGRPPAELEFRSFGVLTSVSRRMELDIVTVKGRHKGRITTCILPRQKGDEYTYVRLERVEVLFRPLGEVLMEAVGDAQKVKPCQGINGLALPAKAAVRAESRRILADWLVFLVDLAGSAAADVALQCDLNGKSVNLLLSLQQAGLEPGDIPSLPFPESGAGLLEEIGGSFRLVSEYPQTSVQLTLPARGGIQQPWSK